MPLSNASGFKPAGLIGNAVGLVRSDACIEIIVVDGASADGTAAVAEGLAVRNRLVRAKRNGYPSAAREAGLDTPARNGSRCWI